MRNIKELLVILLDNVETYMLMEENYTDSLCGVTADLRRDKVITYEEEYTLDAYVDEHMPEDYKTGALGFTGIYGWEQGDVESRILWLKEQINKL